MEFKTLIINAIEHIYNYANVLITKLQDKIDLNIVFNTKDGNYINFEFLNFFRIHTLEYVNKLFKDNIIFFTAIDRFSSIEKDISYLKL